MCTFEKDLECLQSSYHPEVTTVNIIVHCISVPLTAFLYHVFSPSASSSKSLPRKWLEIWIKMLIVFLRVALRKRKHLRIEDGKYK